MPTWRGKHGTPRCGVQGGPRYISASSGRMMVAGRVVGVARDYTAAEEAERIASTAEFAQQRKRSRRGA